MLSVSRWLDTWRSTLLRGAEALAMPLSEVALAGLRAHLELVLAHNARAGLTAITDPAGMAIKHYLDSLACLLAREITPGEHVADVGPGGGFPGMVLAIARPESRYTLIEASARRAAFLSLAAKELGLSQVEVLPTRAEEAGGRPDLRAHCDLAVSRAVARLPTLLEYVLPLVRVGGEALAMKGPEAADEIAASARALAILGGRVAAVRELSLPEGKGQRALVLIEKTALTPARYPRRAGTPARRPL